MDRIRIGVLGASSFVGIQLLTLLRQQHFSVKAYSRRIFEQAASTYEIEWVQLPIDKSVNIPFSAVCVDNAHQAYDPEVIDLWISVAPIWVLSDHFQLLKSHGIKRIVALSSTSRFVKVNSSDLTEQGVSKRLSEGEEKLQVWANLNEIDWVILRPTMIYGYGGDKNVSVIAKFIRQFRFFPLMGNANGLRQPVHADDVAKACVSALLNPHVRNQAYNITGGETLTYKNMVLRIFSALNIRPRLLHVPLWVFHLAIQVVRILPRYRNWTTAMADRMNQDLCFDYTEANHDFGFSPRYFSPLD